MISWTNCETDTKLNITPNCILLPYDTKREGALILRKFKTPGRTNPKLYSQGLGLQLSDEVRATLQQRPRDYLFTEARSSKPHDIVTPLTHACTWHLSIEDREELAGDMCHSVETQAQYQFIHEPKHNGGAMLS